MESFRIILTDLVIPIVSTFLLALVSVVTPMLVRKLSRRFDLDLDERTESRINRIVTDAIGEAEEWARNSVTAGGDKPASGAKLRRAMDTARREIERSKLPQRTADDLADLIHRKLGQTRKDGT